SFLTSRTRSARQGFGKPVPRREDGRLVTGQGCCSDDFNLPGQAYAQLVRSPHAHARVLRIDGAAALGVPGVLAILTGRDAEADARGPSPLRRARTTRSSSPAGGQGASGLCGAPLRVAPADIVRFVGEPVAMVIAESAAAALDGVERVVVDYEPLPAVTATR